MIPSFWFRWLQVVTIGVILFGALMFVWPDVVLDLFSLIFYSETGGFQVRHTAEAIVYMRFIHGDLGSTIVGWCTTVFLVLNGPFRRCERGAWLMLALPLVLWYVTNSWFSVYTGFWHNVVFNLVFLSLYAIPLAATRKYFRR